MSIHVINAGLLSTVQDTGRKGYQQFGVPVAGSADISAHRMAQLLCGNDINAALIECTMFGPELEFDADTVFAVTGAKFSPVLNGNPIELNRAYKAEAGSVLIMGSCSSGLRGYIAFSGGIDSPVIMGSRSVYAKAGIGAPLKAGDVLEILPVEAPRNLPARRLSVDAPADGPVTLRCVAGPQDDAFTDEALKTFTSAVYTVTADSDRMGCRLSGEKLNHKNGADIISDGIVNGSVQVPVSGQPIIMLADHQTTGGYTKIATVISTDLPLIAQCRPGDSVRFSFISVEDAQKLYIENEERFSAYERVVSRACGETKTFEISVNGNSYSAEITEITD